MGERATASANGGRSKLAVTGGAFQAAGSALSLSGLRLSDPLIQHHQAFTSSAGAYEAQGGEAREARGGNREEGGERREAREGRHERYQVEMVTTLRVTGLA